MKLPDTNVLVNSVNEFSPFRNQAAKWLEKAFDMQNMGTQIQQIKIQILKLIWPVLLKIQIRKWPWSTLPIWKVSMEVDFLKP